MISSTREEVRRRIVADSNVIVLAAAEPAFAQLQAACAFAAFAMVHTGLKGGGEANFCNAMWHGKAVVVADTMAASDYVVHGETGYVVPAGDAESLRERILELWNDPEKARGMGREARRHVSENFTHEQFIARLVRLAAILASEVNGESGGVHSGR